MGGVARVWDDEQVAAALRRLPHGHREGDALVRTAELPSFAAAIEVVRAVAEVAEERDHHPDIDVRYRTLVFRCTTHWKGAITAKDADLAAAIDDVLTALGS